MLASLGFLACPLPRKLGKFKKCKEKKKERKDMVAKDESRFWKRKVSFYTLRAEVKNGSLVKERS